LSGFCNDLRKFPTLTTQRARRSSGNPQASREALMNSIDPG